MDRLDCDRMFIAVIEMGSFTAAADRLGTSSGQASKLVSRLEEILGVRLLNRTTRAVAATEAGQAYYRRLRPLIDEFDELDALTRSTGNAPRGRVRLSAPVTFGAMVLGERLNLFAGLYPEISLEVEFSDRHVSLVDEAFDLAVRVGRPKDSSLVARKLCEMRLLIVATDSYLAKRGTPDTAEDLARHECILDSNFADPTRWPVAGGGVVGVSGRLRFSEARACLSAAEAGLGIACLPAFVAGPSLTSGRLRRILPEAEPEAFVVHAVYPRGRFLAGNVRLLVDHLAESFRGPQQWDRGWS